MTSYPTDPPFGLIDRARIDYLLTTTRNVRKRLDLNRAVPLELIEECIDLAVQAPTGCNAQTWRFLIITDPEKRRKLAELYMSREWLFGFADVGAARHCGLTVGNDFRSTNR